MNKRSDLPFPGHPRPLLERENWINFNGVWDFAVSPSSAIPEAFPLRINVPYPPQSRLSGIGGAINKRSYIYYRTHFTAACPGEGMRFFLRFGAVDREAAVYINGRQAALHEGGYLPFDVDLTCALREGENELIVRVFDNTSMRYPYGKQRIRRGGMWYTPVSGIWQTVFGEWVPEKQIESVCAVTEADRIRITVKGGEKEKTLRFEETGKEYAFTGDTLVLDARAFPFWTPDEPHLFRFTLRSGKDVVRSYLARRTVECREDGIYLNGERTFFHGLLDQGYYEDGIFLPENEEVWREDLLLLKSMGFNMLRKHIKLEPQRFYCLCDELGVIVFQDMINSGKYHYIYDTVLPTIGVTHLPEHFASPRRRRIFLECAEGMQDVLRGHPSVVGYTIFNEGWGQFSSRAVYRRLKARDPSRFYDTASGWFVPPESDVRSIHTYFKPFRMPRNANKPVVLSEFGGYSLPLDGHRFNLKKNYGYKLFESSAALTDALTALYEETIVPAVRAGLSAAVLTQLSDVEDETNGIVTYDRAIVKPDREKLRAVGEKLQKAARAYANGIAQKKN